MHSITYIDIKGVTRTLTGTSVKTTCFSSSGLDQKFGPETERIILCGSFVPKIQRLVRIQGLPRLKVLLLPNNKITTLEDFSKLGTLTETLEKLYLDYNCVKETTGLDKFKKLHTLRLQNNSITRIRGLEKVTSLECLDLSGNGIQKIEGLNTLVNLRHLSLNVNCLRKIEGLSNLRNLRYLALGYNNIMSLSGLSGLTNLEILRLCHVSLHNDQLGELVNLTRTMKHLQGIDTLHTYFHSVKSPGFHNHPLGDSLFSWIRPGSTVDFTKRCCMV